MYVCICTLLSEESQPHLATILNITMSQTSMSTVYHYIDTRKLPLILCEVVNELTPTQVKGAQLFTGIWSIWLKSYLLDGKFSLSIGNHRIFIYGEYPVIMRRAPTEKVIFKNVLFHVNDDDLLKYIIIFFKYKVQYPMYIRYVMVFYTNICTLYLT